MRGCIQPYTNLWRRSDRGEGRECTSFSVRWRYCRGGLGKEYIRPKRHGQNITISVGVMNFPTPKPEADPVLDPQGR